MKKFLFDLPFAKKTTLIALPLMVQQLISVAVNLVDNLMIGYLGDAAIASVAAVNKYYLIAQFAINGLAAAASVFIAQYHGSNEKDKMQESFRTLLLISFCIMSLFTLIGKSIPSMILSYFSSDLSVIENGVKYLGVVAFSFIPTAVSLNIFFSMRAVGEMHIPLRCSVIAVLTNAILNYCFIFGNFGFPRLGIEGAALATVIARFVEITLALFALKRYDFPFKTKITEIFHISKEVFTKVIVKAAPLMLNEILWSFGMATLFKFYSTRGSDVMSGNSAASTISDLFFTLFGGMSAATTVLVSIPLGANQLDHAKENAYKLVGYSFMLSILFGVLMFASSLLVPILYSHITLGAQHAAIRFIRVQACMFWIYMLTTEFYFILRAGGDMKHTLLMDSGFMWSVIIPVVGIFTYFTNINFLLLYVIGQLTDLVKLVVAYRLVSKEHWVVNLTLNPAEE